jgi:hypothetical protein
MSEKFEKLLDLLVNEEKAKAEDLFHEIVVDKSREIYEELVSNDAEKESIEEKKESDEAPVEETKKEEIDEKAEEKADEDKEEVDEKAEAKADEDKKVDEKADTTKEDEDKKVDENFSDVEGPEAIETVGGDATDDLVADITADEVGEVPAQASEDMTQDELEDKVMDLEDALDELKAEFEKMDGGYGDDEENGDEPELDVEIDPEADPEADPEMEFPAPEEESRIPFEGKDEEVDETKEKEDEGKTKSVDEHLREYSEMITADMSGDDDGGSKKSPVASAGGAKSGASPVKTDTKEEKGGSAPAPKADTAKYQNRAGGTVKQSPAPKPKASE